MLNLKETAIGIELGSTRIKAVLINKDHKVLAQGDHTWENSLIDGIWTYSLEEVKEGLQDCFRNLKEDVKEKHGVTLNTAGVLGVSAMMHGYLPFNEKDEQICEFRTWRNTITGEAAEKLSDLFDFNIPQRWSIAHLYQAILNKEGHLKDLSYITTLAGYVHYLLSGEKVMGIGEASGMFPIDSKTMDYDEQMVEKFNALDEVKAYGLDLKSLLPKVIKAGEDAGTLTKKGALYLDPTGEFEAGVVLAPCEGDAGTGMTATDSVRTATGNV
ncbi:MAG: ATPase, partial [Erysipelotrichaceae bacterium]|nr:ATPase [Erysipelotrichaceae bacterium]